MASIYDFATKFRTCLTQLEGVAPGSSKSVEIFQGAQSFLKDFMGFLTILELRQDAACVGELAAVVDDMLLAAKTAQGRAERGALVAESTDKARNFIKIVQMHKDEIRLKKTEQAAKAMVVYEEALRHAHMWAAILKGAEAISVEVDIRSVELDQQKLKCGTNMAPLPYGHADRHPAVVHEVNVAYQGTLNVRNFDEHLCKVIEVKVHCDGRKTTVEIYLPVFLSGSTDVTSNIIKVPAHDRGRPSVLTNSQVFFTGDMSELTEENMDLLVTQLAEKLSYISAHRPSEDDVPSQAAISRTIEF